MQRDNAQPEMETLVAVRDELASATEQVIAKRFPPANTIATPIRSWDIPGNEPFARAVVVIPLGLFGVLVGGLNCVRQLISAIFRDGHRCRWQRSQAYSEQQ
jgi:hypothetical protein